MSLIDQDAALHQVRHSGQVMQMLRQTFHALADKCLSIFSLPWELLLHARGMGIRYYSIQGLFLAAWFPSFLHWCWVAFKSLFTLLPMVEHKSPLSSTFLFHWFLFGIFCWGVILKLRMMKRSLDGAEVHTLYAGKSWRVFDALSEHILMRLPGQRRNLAEEVSKRVVEPLCAYIIGVMVAVHLDSLLGWWLWFGAVALGLRAQLAFSMIRDSAHDLFDATLEGRILHQNLQQREARRLQTHQGAEQGVFAYAAMPTRIANQQPDRTRPTAVRETHQPRRQSPQETSHPSPESNASASERIRQRKKARQS